MSVQSNKARPSVWNEKYSQPGYVYGTEPCQWLRMNQHRLPTEGRALAIADGEGRNGVFLAQQGLQVTSVDLSEVGLAKAQALASTRGVQLQTVIADLRDYEIAPGSLAVAIAIYAHLPSDLRPLVHRRIAEGLQPGGLFVLEAFHPNQLKYTSGGPRSVDLLYRVDEVLADFSDCHIVEALEGQTALTEGHGHLGLGYVTRLIIQKGALA